jgi:hypothetical protein
MPVAQAAQQAPVQSEVRPGVKLPPGWVLGWLLAAILLAATAGPAALRHEFADPDNSLRLVQVRDLLNGQAWFDPVQHRLNPPEGVPMHWARWIDGALALQIGILTPLLGERAAETAIAFIWPLSLLGLLMFLMARVGAALGGAVGRVTEVAFAAPLVLALSFPAIEKFGPGFLDHHNAVMVLLLSATLALFRLDRHPGWGVALGCAAGVAIGTAAEALPLAAAVLIIAGLRWVIRPDSCGKGFLAAGVAMAISTCLMLMLQVAPDQWGRPVCDAISRGFVGAGAAAGVVATALFAIGRGFPDIGWAGRLAAAAALGGLVAAALAVGFPECAGGGYGAMSETLATLWLPQVSEARSISRVAGDNLTLLLASVGAPVAALAAALAMRKTPGLWMIAALLSAAFAMMVWQVRGATFATLFAAPLCALAIVRARETWRGGGSMLAFAAMLLVSTPAVWAAAGAWIDRAMKPEAAIELSELRAGALACATHAELARLDAAPSGVILNEFSLGAAILQHTGHSVMAAPYHRNEAGLSATVETFRSEGSSPPASLPAGIDYILVCPGLPEGGFYASHAPVGVRPEDTLASRLARGEAPSWLAPVDIGASSLRLYRVVR